MNISRNTWLQYIDMASKLSEEAGAMILSHMEANPTLTPLGLVNYAYGVVTRYGEANSALAAEFYDACASAAGAEVPAAEIVDIPYGDVAKAIYSTFSSREQVVGAVSRLVKRAGADTTLRNAERDGAQFAWIPHGDTCPFCIMLASNGWRYVSKKALKNGHAEHIHAHCDCQYAVRFDKKTNVEGYDPEEYLQQYRDAGSDLNAMRRAHYAENRDLINEQHRAAYRVRQVDNMGAAKNYDIEEKGLIIKTYRVEGTSSMYTQTYSRNAQNTITLVNRVGSELPELDGVAEIVIAKDLPGIAAYDHVNNILFINERLSSQAYIRDVLGGNYFVANNAEETLMHEMFHKRHWDNILSTALTTGRESDIVKDELENDLRSYLSLQISMQPSYLRDVVSMNAYQSFMKCGSLNEVVAEVLLQEYKGEVKDDTLMDLVRRCVL